MNGVINLLKPPGLSSNGAVVQVRKIIGEKKAGHTGTLDPGAAGVLAVCLGKATKLSDFLMDGKKEYIAEIAFGKSTDTQDSYGRVTEEKAAHVSEEDLKRVLLAFTGRITQVTPAYSAAKQNGRALYKLALKGEKIEEKKRDVEIKEIELLRQTGENMFLIRVACGKGTYIRTLCFDIGKALGVPAHMSLLIRTVTSGFCIRDSVTLDELREMAENGSAVAAITPVEEVLLCFDRLELPAELRTKLYNGNTVAHGSLAGLPDGMYRVYCGGFLGTGELASGSLKIATLLSGEEA
jgi:tRNA pseudouridine55 synthase